MKNKDQLCRMLAILPLAQSGESLTTKSLAKMFGITKRQVINDLSTLFMCGLPGGYPDDLIDVDMDAAIEDGVIQISNAEYLNRPLRLTQDEAMSLLAALEVVREAATGEQAKTANSAIAKLEEITGAGSGVHFEISSGSDEVRDRLAAAISNNNRVKLVYDGASRAVTTQPVIDPVLIEVRHGVAYLNAWSLDAKDWRVYRFDRIISVEYTGQSAEDHGEAPSGQWFEKEKDVVLVLAPDAAWVCEYHPCEVLERKTDGSVRARFKVASDAWLTSILLRLGDGARVEDESLAKDSVHAAQQTLKMYDQIEKQ